MIHSPHQCLQTTILITYTFYLSLHFDDIDQTFAKLSVADIPRFFDLRPSTKHVRQNRKNVEEDRHLEEEERCRVYGCVSRCPNRKFS